MRTKPCCRSKLKLVTANRCIGRDKLNERLQVPSSVVLLEKHALAIQLQRRVTFNLMQKYIQRLVNTHYLKLLTCIINKRNIISPNLMVLAELLLDGAVNFNDSDTGTAGKVLGQLLPDGRQFLTVTTPVHDS
jgi:hypothetical protein